MTKKIILIIALLLPLPSFAATPICLYQDVLSGPASGGEGGNGIYLSIFGNNFGLSRGTSTVAVNGTAVAQYLYWGADPTGNRQQIGVQIARGTTGTGNIVVTTPGGSCSNLSFTVRSGRIYFIGPGIDSNSMSSPTCVQLKNDRVPGDAGNGGMGTYSDPWKVTNYASTNSANYNPALMRTPNTYYNCLSSGDTLVFLNGFYYPYYGGGTFNASLALTMTNSSTSPVTLMARPGATAQLGGENWSNYGIQDAIGGGVSYTTVSGLTLSAASTTNTSTGALEVGGNDRIVGSTITCPNCSGQTAALLAQNGANYVSIFGNLITSVSTDTSQLPNGSNKQMHDIYLSGNNQEVAWNRVYKTQAYNCFQINEDNTSGFYNISVHDNDFADCNGSGINFSTVDPSSGYVQAYNNIIHHVGVNVASDGNDDDPHSCLAVKGYQTSSGVGTINFWNNTMYDCTGYLNHVAGGGGYCAVYISPNTAYGSSPVYNSVTTNLVNNIVYQPAYRYTGSRNPYVCGLTNFSGYTAHYSGSNNIWYSASTPGSTAYATTIGKIKNPLYVSAANGLWTNYELQSTSPAIGAGIRVGPVESQGVSDTYLTWDIQQLTRPNPPSIGALQ